MDARGQDPSAPAEDTRLARRLFFERFGWGGLSVLLGLSVPGLVRFLRPRGSQGGKSVLDLGSIRDYSTPAVTTRWVSRHGLWIVHRHSRVFALEARCTHLGCTPRWMSDRGVFRCPCHGSRFSPEGEVLNGPAVRSLPRLAIRIEHERLLVDPSLRVASREAERDSRFFVRV